MVKNKIIESILKAEEKSEKLSSNAKAESVKIVTKAEEENAKLKNDAQESSKKMLKQQTQINEDKFRAEFETSLQEYNARAEELTKNAEKNYDRAINIILKNIQKAK